MSVFVCFSSSDTNIIGDKVIFYNIKVLHALVLDTTQSFTAVP